MHPIAVSPFKMDTRGDKPVGPSRGVSTTTGHSATDGENTHDFGNIDCALSVNLLKVKRTKRNAN